MGECVMVDLDGEVLDAARRVVSAALDSGVTLGCAESCTGGLVSGALTAVPGSSAVVRGGVVSYAIAVKRAVLGVSPAVLDAPGVGAVSSECAAQMAEGARRVLGCDVAVSVTGIAGPGGAEPGKPVGTVWFGLAWSGGTWTHHALFSGSRAEVRAAAVLRACSMLCEGVMKASGGRGML